MNYIKINFSISSETEGETLVALLSEHPFEGFEINEGSLAAYIAENSFDESLLVDLNNQYPVKYVLEQIPQTNWNAEWESSFSPVIIGQFAAVRAHFHPAVVGVAHQVVITPKMSFGTGHHATTAMMMAAMEQIDFSGKAVLDFGTGTGVLAILAEKLGANPVLAIDNDEWSIENTLENIKLNECAHITCQLNDKIEVGETFDVILANINLNVIKASLPALQAVAANGSSLLFSGFLASDENEIKAQLHRHQLVWQATMQQGDWICIRASKR
jgi:ribosomal protein L11 methyltransferase